MTSQVWIKDKFIWRSDLLEHLIQIKLMHELNHWQITLETNMTLELSMIILLCSFRFCSLENGLNSSHVYCFALLHIFTPWKFTPSTVAERQFVLWIVFAMARSDVVIVVVLSNINVVVIDCMLLNALSDHFKSYIGLSDLCHSWSHPLLSFHCYSSTCPSDCH